MNQFLLDAGVLTLAGIHGFRKAATDEFRRHGYRLATIRQEREPHNSIHALSLYALNDPPEKDRRKVLQVVRRVMKTIGCPVTTGKYEVSISGRRVVALVGLPGWAWPEN